MATSLFVSYTYSAAGGAPGFGNHILPNQTAPKSEGDVHALEARLRTATRESRFVILNWIELRDDAAPEARAMDLNGAHTPDV